MSREKAIENANSYFENGEMQSDLSAWVGFETESQNPGKKAELARYLAEAIEPRLSGLGFDCIVHANPDPSGGPILIGMRIEPRTP